MSPEPKSSGEMDHGPPNSVLWTQDLVRSAEQKLREALQAFRDCEARLERAKETHREQIGRSLTSAIPEERRMAQSVAQFWEVPIPDEA